MRLTEIHWGADQFATSFDVVRGDLVWLRTVGQAILLGNVTCLASETAAFSFTENQPANPNPPAGGAWFYLVQYRQNGIDSSYGTATVSYPRQVEGNTSSYRWKFHYSKER